MSFAVIPFGRYRLVERLGSGGMAQVFRAVADGPEGSRSLVVKRILPELSGNPNFARLLVDEARLSALLRHPAIVQVHELGEVDGEYYIAMEYVDGLNVATLLTLLARNDRVMPPALVCYLVHEVAAALAYAHALTDESGRALEIIHRDVSPSNILVSKDGLVKLLDFGIAKAATGIRNEETRTGVVKGKISYMSPEQADAREVDRRSDIFALGVVFWECLTARRLFRGGDDLHTLRLVREAEIEPPSRIAAGIGAELEAVVMKMLSRSREDRYASCDEIVAALSPMLSPDRTDAPAMQRLLDELGPPVATAKPSSSGSELLTAVLGGRVQRTATNAHEEPRPRKSRWLALAILPAVALTLALFLPRSTAPSRVAAVAPAPPVVLAPAPTPSVAPSVASTPAVTPPPAPAKRVLAGAHHRPSAHKRAPRPPEIHDPFSER